MKTYVVKIRPESSFGTPVKGDTLFGAFCWQVAENPSLLQGGLDRWIADYSERPFALFSSAYPLLASGEDRAYALRRPELPAAILGDPESVTSCEERLTLRKRNRARRWLITPKDLRPTLSWEYLVDDGELQRRLSTSLAEKRPAGPVFLQAEEQHNMINRLTMTTGKGDFAPYSMEGTWYLPGMKLVLFVALDEEACSAEQLQDGMERLGTWGFGRDASTGKGRFSVCGIEEIDWPRPAAGQALLTLAPCVPEPGRYREYYFAPFTRFGRHGAQLLHTGKPFKCPVIMADEGGVFIPAEDESIDRPYIGRAVTGVSKAMESTVVQGYALVLPFAMPN